MGMLKNWLRRQRDAEYLTSAPAPALSDLALSRQEAVDLAGAPADTADRMLQMAARYKLDSGAINAERWRAVDMARACRHCTNVGTCRQWLADGETNVDEAGFCPNAGRFREMAGLPAPRRTWKPARHTIRVPHNYI